MSAPYAYPGITKDNCTTPGFFHVVKDKNCLVNAGWQCTSGSGITVKWGVAFDDKGTLTFLGGSTDNVDNNSNRLIIDNKGGYGMIIIAPNNGTFTLQVSEFYQPTQTRLIG